MFQPGFELEALDAMVMVDVLHFMCEHVGELVLGNHQVRHTLPDVDRAAGESEGVDEVSVGNQIELVRQVAMSACGYGVSHAADVKLPSGLLGAQRQVDRGILRAEFPTD